MQSESGPAQTLILLSSTKYMALRRFRHRLTGKPLCRQHRGNRPTSAGQRHAVLMHSHASTFLVPRFALPVSLQATQHLSASQMPPSRPPLVMVYHLPPASSNLPQNHHALPLVGRARYTTATTSTLLPPRTPFLEASNSLDPALSFWVK